MANQFDAEKIAKEITEQYMAEAGLQAAAPVENKEKKLKAAMVLLRNKTILWAVTGLIMTVSLAYLGVAWYTRISNTHAVTFEVADYELAVNDNTDNEFLVNIYTYSNVKQKTAAPGTKGYIPIKISARHSEVDVDYTVKVESKMPDELQKHIRLFYLEKDGKPLVCDLNEAGEMVDENLNKIAEYFLTQPGDYTKQSGHEQILPADSQKVYVPMTKDMNQDYLTIKDTIKLEKEKVLFLYWEWYYDANEAVDTENSGNGFSKDAEMAGFIGGSESLAEKTEEQKALIWAEYEDAWNKLDTDIGKYPEKYAEAMNVYITCTGVQSTPLLSPEKQSPVMISNGNAEEND